MTKVVAVHQAPEGHWVGDGFPVRSVFSYQTLGAKISPFLLMDHAGPAEFEPADRPRGVEQHPHAGFETVTIVYQGEVEHRDSAGNEGRIGPGDVQWMTAGAGLLHEEMHGRDFTRNGGTFEVIQLWVNLPARDKGAAPGYQTLLAGEIPVVELPGGAGRLRVIAGEVNGTRGVARTFTPMNVGDVRLVAGKSFELNVSASFSSALYVLSGEITVDGRAVRESELALLDQSGGRLTIEARADAKVLILSGQPIDEPVVGYGPFVMNSQDEIRQVIENFRHGRMGQMAARAS